MLRFGEKHGMSPAMLAETIGRLRYFLDNILFLFGAEAWLNELHTRATVALAPPSPLQLFKDVILELIREQDEFGTHHRS